MLKSIIIAAGGTGGHIFPGLAVAKELIAKGYVVNWVGTLQGLESKLIPENNINIHYINITGIRGKKFLTKILAPLSIMIAILQSFKLLIKLQPEIVLGMGGFVTGPVGIAAWLLKKKLIIHEQNAIAGTSNRILAFFADQILESFVDSFPKNKRYSSRVILTGNPIRKDLATGSLLPINSKPNDVFKILILGGSRGARFLNQIVPNALGDLANIQILHQTGEQDLTDTITLYLQKNAKHKHVVKPFINNMLEAYLAADLIICRAGASTIFEIIAVGVASILVPLPWAIDDHQTKNAKYLADHNAGILVAQEDLTTEKLKTLILDLKGDYQKLIAMKQAARLLYEPYKDTNSTDRIVNIILNI